MALETFLLLSYAWNSAPTPGTDLSCSLVAVECEFSFSTDLLASKHFELTSSPESVQSFARTLADLLGASQEIAKVLLDEHHTYHRELVNSHRRDHRIYE